MEKRLVVALDIKDGEKAVRMARDLSPEVFAMKINWPLVLYSKPEIISEIASFSRVICDFKVADIPNTNRLIVERVRDLGAYAVIVHSVFGHDSLSAAVEAAGDTRVIAVVSMSHPGAREFIGPLGDRLLDLALSSGTYGIIAPGNDPETLSALKSRSGSLKIFTPGIGAQGGDPAEAVRAGSDYLIVGRAIYDSQDPLGEARRINDRISKATLPQ